MHNFYDDEDLNIDLTPLIDVIFMLLIFFIMTTTFSKPILDIILPESQNATIQEEKEVEIPISLTKEGILFYQNQQITEEEFINLILAKQDLINLFVDKETPFEFFVKIADILKDKREGRFVISTEHTK